MLLIRLNTNVKWDFLGDFQTVCKKWKQLSDFHASVVQKDTMINEQILS